MKEATGEILRCYINEEIDSILKDFSLNNIKDKLEAFKSEFIKNLLKEQP